MGIEKVVEFLSIRECSFLTPSLFMSYIKDITEVQRFFLKYKWFNITKEQAPNKMESSTYLRNRKYKSATKINTRDQPLLGTVPYNFIGSLGNVRTAMSDNYYQRWLKYIMARARYLYNLCLLERKSLKQYLNNRYRLGKELICRWH